MAAYSSLQQAEFDFEATGYTVIRYQFEVGTGYFDAVAQAIAGGRASIAVMGEPKDIAQIKTAE